MTVDLVNPSALPQPDVYRQVAVASGARTVYLSGQVARTAAGTPVGAGDLAAQVEQAFVNVAAGLDAVGASFADLAKLTVYVVDWAPAKMAELGDGAGRAAARLGVPPLAAMTMIGIAALAEPDLLVEIEAIAVLA